MNSFEDFPHSDLDLVGKDGAVRGRSSGIVTSKGITIWDETLVIASGDELRRTLPNGTDETYEVIDPVFQQAWEGIPAHFQVEVRKKGTFAHGTGGNYSITVTGQNSRVNVGSHDQSVNIAVDNGTFDRLRQALTDQVADEAERAKLLAAVADMERARGKEDLAPAYQRFIASAANHMSVISPFLPALGQMFGG